MAGLQGKCPIPSTAVSSLVSVFTITAPANQRVKILGYNLSFNGTSNGAVPIPCYFSRASAAGSGGTGITPYANEEELTETFQSTVTSFQSTGPTNTHTLDEFFIHPQLGKEVYFPQGMEIVVKGGGILSLMVNPAAAVNCSGFVLIEE